MMSDRAPAPVVDSVVVEAICASLRAKHAVTVRVFGQSMFPVIPPGTHVRFIPASAASVRVGDVALVERSDAFDRHVVAHRVIAIGDGWIRTRGDAFADEDGFVPAEAVLGIAHGVLLGKQWSAPRIIAVPINRWIGVASNGIRVSRRHAGGLARMSWNAARRAPYVAALRRRLQPYDIEPFGPRWLTHVRALLLSANKRPTRELVETWASAARRDPWARAWVAAHRDVACGWLLARCDEDGRATLELWVARSYRGIGVGSALVETALDTANEAGWKEIRIRARAPMAAWLRARGFELVGSARDGVLELRRSVALPRDCQRTHVKCG